MGFYNYKNNLEFNRDIFVQKTLNKNIGSLIKLSWAKNQIVFLELPQFLELLKGATQTFQTFQNLRKANNKKKQSLS